MEVHLLGKAYFPGTIPRNDFIFWPFGTNLLGKGGFLGMTCFSLLEDTRGVVARQQFGVCTSA